MNIKFKFIYFAFLFFNLKSILFAQTKFDFIKETLKIQANTKHTKSLLNINKDDCVIIEAIGSVHINSNSYNPKSITKHDLLKEGVNDGDLTFKLNNSIIHENIVEKLWIERVLPNYTIAFIATKSGNLEFCLYDKDNDYTNNSGSYTVFITKITKNQHFSRNNYNKCPLNEPTKTKFGYLDCDSNLWSKETILSWYYHGVGNSSYRGEK